MTYSNFRTSEFEGLGDHIAWMTSTWPLQGWGTSHFWTWVGPLWRGQVRSVWAQATAWEAMSSAFRSCAMLHSPATAESQQRVSPSVPASPGGSYLVTCRCSVTVCGVVRGTEHAAGRSRVKMRPVPFRSVKSGCEVKAPSPSTGVQGQRGSDTRVQESPVARGSWVSGPHV